MVYKYFQESRISFIKDLLIRFTPPKEFNDTFEFNPVLNSIAPRNEIDNMIAKIADEVIESEFRKYGVSTAYVRAMGFGGHLDKLKEELPRNVEIVQEVIKGVLHEKIIDTLNSRVGVLCLSSKWNSQLMWAHYGGSHRGFCVGFDERSPFFAKRRSDRDECGWLRPVSYRGTRPSVSLIESSAVEWFLTKADCWAYEVESRMFMPLSSATKVTGHADNPIHLFSVPSGAIGEIIIGRNASRELVDSIRSFSKEAGLVENTKFYRIQNSDLSYELQRVRA